MRKIKLSALLLGLITMSGHAAESKFSGVPNTVPAAPLTVANIAQQSANVQKAKLERETTLGRVKPAELGAQPPGSPGVGTETPPKKPVKIADPNEFRIAAIVGVGSNYSAEVELPNSTGRVRVSTIPGANRQIGEWTAVAISATELTLEKPVGKGNKNFVRKTFTFAASSSSASQAVAE